MFSYIKDIIFDSNVYDVIITIIAVILAFSTMYNKIKYFCLEKAAEKVAEVEKDKELTGSQKFAKVVLWINQDLPKLFKNKLFNIIVEKLVNCAYDNSKEYAINYIKRKTGYDISELLKYLPDNLNNSSDNTSSDKSTNSKNL